MGLIHAVPSIDNNNSSSAAAAADWTFKHCITTPPHTFCTALDPTQPNCSTPELLLPLLLWPDQLSPPLMFLICGETKNLVDTRDIVLTHACPQSTTQL
jgi:hypothetical protein